MAAAAAVTSVFSVLPKPAPSFRFHSPRCSIAGDPAVDRELPISSRISADCVVVGGGISGLCTAQALATRNAGAALEVLVTEARPRVGGNITTVERDGYLWEEGPNSFQPSDPVLSMAVTLPKTRLLLFISSIFAYLQPPFFLHFNGSVELFVLVILAIG